MTKQSKIDPRRRLRSANPFHVWHILQRHAVFVKLSDSSDHFLSNSQIAERLFSNWNELSEYDQTYVIAMKLYAPLSMLVNRGYIVKDTASENEFQISRWKLHDLFDFLRESGSEQFLSTMAFTIDHQWGDYTGRNVRQARLMEKYL